MPPSADAPTSHGLAPGSEIPGYRILGVIGAGGFGITYLAEHTTIHNRAAVKEFLPAGIAARTSDGSTVRPVSEGARKDFAWGLERFRQEARMLGALDHPNIVRVLNFVEANGTAYTVMEHVEGEGLDKRLQRQPVLKAAEIAALLPGLLAGLEAVHAAGMLHRDIKPENVILKPNGQPVLIDFGAARQAFGSRSLTAVLSEGYAPYEQYDEHGNQGPWTDVYALGGLLYRCVAGERPVTALRRIEARVKGKGDPLVPAAERGRGRFPPALLAAIDAALAPMEADRPQDVAGLRALVDDAPHAAPPGAPSAAEPTLFAGARGRSPVHAAPPSSDTLVAASGAARRDRSLSRIVAAALVLLAAGAAAAYVVVDGRRGQEAAEARQKAEEEAKRAAEARRRDAEEEQKRRTEAEARRTAEAAAVKEADGALDNGAAAVARRDYDAAIPLLTRAIDSGRLSRERLAYAHHIRAKAWREKRDNDRAFADLEKALALDPRIAGSWEDRAAIKAERRDFAGALADIDQALRLKPGEANFHTTRGYILGLRRDFDGAIASFTESLRLRPGHAYTHYNRGVAWWNKGDAQKAIADYRSALRAEPGFELARRALRELGQNP